MPIPSIELPEGLVTLGEDGKLTTTSLKVAEVFGKRHGNVVRDIQYLECSKEFNQLNFELVEYMDKKGELRPSYGKEHKNVIRIIKSLNCNEEYGRLNFEPTNYLDKQGKTKPLTVVLNLEREIFPALNSKALIVVRLSLALILTPVNIKTQLADFYLAII
ncbi:Rha family transcriptional regulator [Desulfobacula sp.]|uniref:Rha family transcriptional regulator n=1 Tax=Desulfobacula sp. TaxID=2593537 RepID=UPI00262DDD27|nr:Rha family transcriptional regulator [Desulfobacula sp.]